MGEHGAPTDSRWAADLTARARRADDDARALAARIADTALGVAATFDRIAATREACAALVTGEPAAQLRESARRARAMAESERLESRQLRATWRRPG